MGVLKIITLIILFLLIFTSFFPAFALTESPEYGDAIIVGSIGEPSVLIPMLASDSASHDVAGLIYKGLVKYDIDLTLIGDLAESWDISNDGLIITFYL